MKLTCISTRILRAAGIGIALSAVGPCAAAGPQIAYITPSRSNSEIHVITPGGSADRLLWRIPGEVPPENGIGTVSWSPDGKAVAFDSAHQWRQSLAERDIFVLNLEDNQLIRPTDAPNPDAFGKLPKGTVTVDVVNGVSGRKLDVYVEGAGKPVTLLARDGLTYRVQLENVADFGRGIAQQVRVYDYLLGGVAGGSCRFDLTVSADVTPGKTVHAGKMGLFTDYSCPVTSAPIWRADGKALFFLYREPTKAISPR